MHVYGTKTKIPFSSKTRPNKFYGTVCRRLLLIHVRFLVSKPTWIVTGVIKKFTKIIHMILPELEIEV